MNLVPSCLKDVCSLVGQTKAHMSHIDINRMGKLSEYCSQQFGPKDHCWYVAISNCISELQVIFKRV